VAVSIRREGGTPVTDVPEGAQRSEDGQWWWDGEQWQPVGGADSSSPSSSTDASSEASSEYASYDTSSSEQTTNQFNADDFPSLARVLYFGEDVDGYLQDLGIDTSDLDSDESTGPLVS
jgi:hypothetical protein